MEPKGYVYGEPYEVQPIQLETLVRDMKAGDMRFIDREDIIINSHTYQTSVCEDVQTYSFEEMQELFKDGNLFEFCIIGCFLTQTSKGADGLGLVIDDSLMGIWDWSNSYN